jgi:type II secretory pathway pseudopilin PulG
MERLKNSKGFTLLELITILVLLGFVIAGGFRLYFFADRSFMAGSSMADLQAELHWAMQKITDEVRLAHSLRVGESKKELLAHLPNGGAELSLFFIYPENGSIYLETPNGQRQLLDGTSAGTAYKVSFDPVTLEQPGGEPLTNLLRITLTSEGLERDFGLESEIQVLNLRTEGIQGDQGEVIMFTKTFTPEEFDAAEKLRPGCVFGRYVYDPQAPELNALRQFRDNTLAVTPWGRFLVKAYYSVSPVLISFVERYAWAKAPVVKIFETAAQLVLRFS